MNLWRISLSTIFFLNSLQVPVASYDSLLIDSNAYMVTVVVTMIIIAKKKREKEGEKKI